MHARVSATHRLTPSMVRIVLEGGDLGTFEMVDATDAYVNVALRPAGAPYDDVFDPREVRDRFSREYWPARRRYTVRSWDPAARRLTIDFVVHGGDRRSGPDGPRLPQWARRWSSRDRAAATGRTPPPTGT